VNGPKGLERTSKEYEKKSQRGHQQPEKGPKKIKREGKGLSKGKGVGDKKRGSTREFSTGRPQPLKQGQSR